MTKRGFRPTLLSGGLYMKGGIYTDQKRAACRATLKDDASKRLCCPDHPGRIATSFRQTIRKETQSTILGEISQIAPYKVYLGIKWLSTYISIRPGELVQIREQDIDTQNRYILYPSSKTGDTKPVPILDEDIVLSNQVKPGFPRSYFFRYETGKGGVKNGEIHNKIVIG